MAKKDITELTLEDLAQASEGEQIEGLSNTVGALEYDDEDEDDFDEDTDEDDDDVSGIPDDNIIASMVDDDADAFDGLDEIGKLSPAARKRIARLKKRLAAIRRRRKKRKWAGRRILPFDRASIAAGETETFTARPTHTFRMQRLVATGAGLRITGIFVQGTNQLESVGEVPIEVFSGTGSDLNFVFKTCPRNSEIQLQVSNPTAGAVTFTAAALGLVR